MAVPLHLAQPCGSGGGGNRTRDTFPQEPRVDPEIALFEAALEKQHGPIRPYRPRREGFVYFIQADSGGPIKIGWSKQPRKRLASIQASHSERLNIRKLVRGRTEDEARFHKRFSSGRLFNEWFEPIPDLVAFLEDA